MSILSLFWTFFQFGLVSFGGGYVLVPLLIAEFGFFCTLCKKWEWNIRNPCAVKSQSGIIGRDAPFYSV